jgi:hypothetical protein
MYCWQLFSINTWALVDSSIAGCHSAVLLYVASVFMSSQRRVLPEAHALDGRQGNDRVRTSDTTGVLHDWIQDAYFWCSLLPPCSLQ